MRNLNVTLRLFVEAIFILVGLFLLWIALTGRYLFNPRRPSWLLLAALMILWGVRRWWGAARSPARKWRTVGQIGGASLSVAGLLMLSLAWAPLDWAHWLVMATGSVLILRGLVAAILVAMPTPKY